MLEFDVFYLLIHQYLEETPLHRILLSVIMVVIINVINVLNVPFAKTKGNQTLQSLNLEVPLEDI